MMYLALKHSHLLLVVVSVVLFITRFVLLLIDSKIRNKKWLKVMPHVIDTLLLLSGVALIYVTGFMPFAPGGEWLTEKLFCVILYIALGFVALKPSCGILFRVFAFGGALGWLFLAASLAVTKTPYY